VEGEDGRHCAEVCGLVNRDKGSGRGQGEMHRCCDFSSYAVLMRSGRYIGCLCVRVCVRVSMRVG